MKKSQIDEILHDQTKRRKNILLLFGIVLLLIIITIFLLCVYCQKNKKQYVKYDEKSDIDYKVYLKDNDFFKNTYLDKDKQYIASLIDYIDADFNYSLSLKEKDIEYKYSYRIEANVSVKEKNESRLLYNNTILLFEEKKNISNSSDVNINKQVKIDYNYYNDLIKKFINIYDLDDTESTLNINMYVNVLGSCEEFSSDSSKEAVITLSIPLTTKTVAIDFGDNLINSENNLLLCNKTNGSWIYILLTILTGSITVGIILYTINYSIKTTTAENIYEKQLKKILNNYGSYIQVIGNDFEFDGYQLLKVNSFNDMLEIRDTVKQPILMKENNNKTGTYFVIPSNTKILYVYRLKVSDIRKDFKKN